MSGKNAYTKIKQTRPDIKAIFTSGYTADVIQSKSFFEENVTLITKPFLPDKLLFKIREVLDG
jgi:CheY-like chemotaxis protein